MIYKTGINNNQPRLHRPEIKMSECCICYEQIGEKNNCVTECGHEFCFKCVVTSMRRNNGCPICRAPLTEEEHNVAEVSDDDTYNDEDEDEDEDEDDDDDEEDENYYDDECDYEYVSDEKINSSANLARRLESSGISYVDLVSMMISRFGIENTADKITSLYNTVEKLKTEVDAEKEENGLFEMEDDRSRMTTTVIFAE